jgi:hypothetical protein
MQDQLMDIILTQWVNPIVLQEFMKNPGASCCVVVVVKGIPCRAYLDFTQILIQRRVLG